MPDLKPPEELSPETISGFRDMDLSDYRVWAAVEMLSIKKDIYYLRKEVLEIRQNQRKGLAVIVSIAGAFGTVFLLNLGRFVFSGGLWVQP